MHQGMKFIDADAHVLEPEDLWRRYLDPRFKDEMPWHFAGYKHVKISGETNFGVPRAYPGGPEDPLAYIVDVHVQHYTIPDFLAGTAAPVPHVGDVYEDYARQGFSPSVYRAHLERTGVDYMALYPTVGLFVTGSPSLPAETAAAYRRAENDWQYDFLQEAGTERLIGVAAVDLRDPKAAALEARRCVRDLGFKAVFTIPEMVNQYPFFHSFYDPFYAELQDLDVPLAFHPTSGTALNEGGSQALFNSSGRATAAFCFGQMTTSMALIVGGVLERFPRLRVVHLEVGCGWVPYWMDRMQAGVQGSNRREGMERNKKLTMHPLDYFRRQCYVAADPDDPHVKVVQDMVGNDNLVTATDFAHPEGRYHLEAFNDLMSQKAITDETRRKMMWDNPARLYGIKA